jgi:putative intracellular protease/amidase
MSRKILIVLSEWGFWGEELIGPLDVFDAAGYESVFATPTGRRPVAIGVSKDPSFVDPPLGRSVTTPEMAAKVQAIDDPANPRLNKPVNLSTWFPMQPYWSAPEVLRQWEAYYRDVARAQEQLQQYDALLMVGGSGPLVDMANNHRIHELIFGFLSQDKPVAAECYAVTCLAFARDLNDRKSIIWGKRVTGHCKEYDYLDGTGFMQSYNQFLDFNMGPPPYPLEYILRDATGPDGGYIGNVGRETSVIVDYPFITGRSTPDSTLTGQMVVEVLERGLRRYGW